MRQRIARSVVLLGVGASVLAPAIASHAMTIAKFTDPGGCTHSVYGPDILIHSLPNPGVSTSGGFGESVSCP
jgi:hypothetical protein